jgi:hypothetical protein
MVSEKFGNGDVTNWYQSFSFNTEPAWVEYLLKEKFRLVSSRIWNYNTAMVCIK